MGTRALAAVLSVVIGVGCETPAPPPTLSPEPRPVVPVAPDAGAGARVDASCPPPDVPPPSVARPACVRRPGAPSPRVLPSGLYFRVGHHERSARGSAWPDPLVALVAGVYETPDEADRAVRAVPPSAQAPGYPWAVDVQALRPVDAERRGITVVLGLFASDEAANDWCAVDPTTRASTELLRIMPFDWSTEPRDVRSSTSNPVQTVPWAEVPAFAPGTLAPLYDERGERLLPPRSFTYYDWIERHTRTLPAVCRLSPGPWSRGDSTSAPGAIGSTSRSNARGSRPACATPTRARCTSSRRAPTACCARCRSSR